jgi:dTDP-glucose 4,6-dehydratase
MKILITGGLGFVGTNLLQKIIPNPRYSQITVLDNLLYTANPEVLAIYSRSKNFKFVQGDVRNENLLKDLVRDKDQVIHLAAQTFVDNSIKDSKIFFETNVLGVHSLLEAIRESKVKKLLHVSTDEVWGETLGERGFTEEDSYNPRNPYSASKAAADHIVSSYGETYGINYNIVYLTNLVGPWQYPEKLIPSSIIKLMLNKKISVYGDGKNVRTWLYVEDAINGMLKVLENADNKERYILGGEIEITNIDLIDKLLSFFEKGRESVEFVSDRPGHDFRYAVDISKAKKDLRWEPKWGLDKILTKVVDWYKLNEEWWRKKI